MNRVIVVVALVSGCDKVLGLERAPMIDASPDALDLGPWTNPRILGDLNSVRNDSDASITSDGLEIYFSSDRDRPNEHEVFRATRTSASDDFGAPVRVDELTQPTRVSGAISPDGLTFYSNRGVAGDYQIFQATRPSRTADFGQPVLVMEMSSAANDQNPTVSGDACVAIVDRNVAGDQDPYLFERPSKLAPWTIVGRINELSTNFADGGATLDMAGLTIVFGSDRPDADGKADLFVATRVDVGMPFDTPVLITELSTSGNENDAHITPDQRIIVFNRDDDLWIATR